MGFSITQVRYKYVMTLLERKNMNSLDILLSEFLILFN